MNILKFSAMACDKRMQKVLSVASPTLRHFSMKRVIIEIETESEPNEQYIRETIKRLESNPISDNEYFAGVKLVGCSVQAQPPRPHDLERRNTDA